MYFSQYDAKINVDLFFPQIIFSIQNLSSFLLSLWPQCFHSCVKPLQIKLLFPPLWFSNMPPAQTSMLPKTPWLKSSPHLLKTLVVDRISSSFQSIHQSNPEILENVQIPNWLITELHRFNQMQFGYKAHTYCSGQILAHCVEGQKLQFNLCVPFSAVLNIFMTSKAMITIKIH